ncbi:phospholipid-binding protein [Desulfoluna limicola]|uniref:Phospholipid-binding protein n=1 Tax=Desulfoluna limicola TaxID=2810562 RepID=A0ABN6EZR7_9BACT|nr:cytidylate kinase-like family protein [Desulfoluna limicola]BCS95189.1 phospholipid-binding protein [Desulfoluna limicola]
MSIITISRSFCSKGKVVAEKVAETMGYECISREVLLEASEQFNVPEIKLAKAIHDGPTIYDRFTLGKERYIAFIKSALLNRLKNGNIVYHGLAGHFFIQDVPHILKIRLLADMEARVAEEMGRDNVSESVARKRIAKDDKERFNWSSYLYKIDTRDCELYDLTINLRYVSVEDCITIIRNTLALPYFKDTRKAEAQLKDLALSATIKAAIVHKYYTAEVTSKAGKVVIKLPEPVAQVEKTKDDMKSLIEGTQGINEVYFNIISNSLPRTAMHK